VAIEGVIRQEKLETSQLAVDTHGYTDFAMSHARLLGFDLCPRLKELKQRHLFVPRHQSARRNRCGVRSQCRRRFDRKALIVWCTWQPRS
jgi:TnpA family transposase